MRIQADSTTDSTDSTADSTDSIADSTDSNTDSNADSRIQRQIHGVKNGHSFFNIASKTTKRGFECSYLARQVSAYGVLSKTGDFFFDALDLELLELSDSPRHSFPRKYTY